MAIITQAWTDYVTEENPDGPSNPYTAATCIAHLVAWFTTNNTQWTITASTATYLELKPPAGAINTDDRVLIYGGVSPDAAALAPDANANATYIYVCYAPNAGTTGPDTDPASGNPYSVTSSKLVIATPLTTTFDRLQVFMSDDVLFIAVAPHINSYTGLCFVGRAYNPIGTEDQFTIVAGMGESVVNTWSQTLGSPTAYWNADEIPGSADTSIFVQESAGDVAWKQCRRINGWDANSYKTDASANKFYQNILLGSNEGATTELLGSALFAKAGAAEVHGTEMADGGGVRGYAISMSGAANDRSTWYLWDT